MTTYTITSIFDVNCPWCYIGHTHMHRAIYSHKKSHPKDSFVQKLVPFYLKPPPQLAAAGIPPVPVPTQSRQQLREETYAKAGADIVVAEIQGAAQQSGLHLKFNGRTGTTRNAHRLIYHATQLLRVEVGEKVLDDLFRGYHEQEFDITDLKILTDVGVQNGLASANDVEKWLLSGEDGEVVDDMAKEAGRKFGGGVPKFIVGVDGNEGDALVSGAREESEWKSLFDRLKV